jgi:hypothetical protein
MCQFDTRYLLRLLIVVLLKQKFLPAKKTYCVGESPGSDQKTPVVLDERFFKEHFEIIKPFHFQSSPTNADKDHTTGCVKSVPNAAMFSHFQQRCEICKFLNCFCNTLSGAIGNFDVAAIRHQIFNY